MPADCVADHVSGFNREITREAKMRVVAIPHVDPQEC